MAADRDLLIADLMVGVLLLVLGVAAARLQARGATARLLLASGIVWLLADVFAATTFWHRALLVHLVLAYPDGRLHSAVRRMLVVAGYVYAGAYLPARWDAVTLALGAAVVAVAVRRHQKARGPARRGSAVAMVAAVGLGVAFCSGAVSRLFGSADRGAVLTLYDLLVLGVCAWLVGDIGWQRFAPPPVTALIIDLGEVAGSGSLQDRLGHALGDPSVVVGYWLPAKASYVDDSGCDVELPGEGSGRSVTPVTTDGQPLAVLVHAPEVLADPRLMADVAAATGWAVANVRLGAELNDRVAAVAASRLRLVTAADDERQRWEAMLHQGVEERLRRVRKLIVTDVGGLGDLTDAVDRTRFEVRELARGLHPRTLTAAGLQAALRELASQSALAVQLEVSASRLPPIAEAAVYYICAEALVNTAKYAGASAALVQVTVSSGQRDVRVVVSDDGVGGADLARGSGLRGIADRAEAAGGWLDVVSPAGRGTVVSATLPLTGSDQRVVMSS